MKESNISNIGTNEKMVNPKNRLVKRLLIFMLVTIATFISIKITNNLEKEINSVILEVYAVETELGYYENYKDSEQYLIDLEKEDVKDWLDIE